MSERERCCHTFALALWPRTIPRAKEPIAGYCLHCRELWLLSGDAHPAPATYGATKEGLLTDGANALPGGLHDAEGRLMGEEPAYHHLMNLLAVVHRDGGHYAVEHGIEKASEDAQAEVIRLRGELTEENARLVAALQEAQGKAALADEARIFVQWSYQACKDQNLMLHFQMHEDWLARYDALGKVVE